MMSAFKKKLLKTIEANCKELKTINDQNYKLYVTISNSNTKFLKINYADLKKSC